MAETLGDCCDQDFQLGDKIQCISDSCSGWVHRLKRLHVKDSFVIKWIDGPRAGQLQMFLKQSICDDFVKTGIKSNNYDKNSMNPA